MDFVLLIASFAVILAGRSLFTNAVEWIGHRLKLGEGAVGSLLAAVGTAMPETLIAIVALIEGTKNEDIAVGAIVGAPFLLATLAMGLVGLTAYVYRRRALRASSCAPTSPRWIGISPSSSSSSRSASDWASAPRPGCRPPPGSPSSPRIRSTCGSLSAKVVRPSRRRPSIR